MKALTIDDSQTVRTLVRNILEENKFEVLEAINGAEGLKVIEVNKDIDVIFLDWEMPVMDGYGFLSKVRSEKLADNSRIIMLTTLNKMTNILQAIDAGADEYLMKPFTPEMVMEKIDSVLST
ncbi:response regulator [candidate division KSB1 bacterium]|nr:response regulator [candidate division KSB1 bacterium]